MTQCLTSYKRLKEPFPEHLQPPLSFQTASGTKETNANNEQHVGVSLLEYNILWHLNGHFCKTERRNMLTTEVVSQLHTINHGIFHQSKFGDLITNGSNIGINHFRCRWHCLSVYLSHSFCIFLLPYLPPHLSYQSSLVQQDLLKQWYDSQ